MPGRGPEGADAREETPGMKILCAIDGSRHSQWALDWLPHVCSPDNCSLLFSFAKYPVACYGDEGEENPP